VVDQLFGGDVQFGVIGQRHDPDRRGVHHLSTLALQ
jgi:hypothetical protein